MEYTITKEVDKDLAGVPAKLVLQFEEGSALEITMDQIVQIKPTGLGREFFAQVTMENDLIKGVK